MEYIINYVTLETNITMTDKTTFLNTIPVIPSQDIERDIKWYEKHTGFKYLFGDNMYASIKREHIEVHLQWHADNEEDPLLGGSVVKIFVKNIQPIFNELVERGTVPEDKLRLNTPWGTNEVGFYDLNKNAIFFVEDV